MSFVPHCFSSSSVRPVYSRIWRLTNSTSPAARQEGDQAWNAVHEQARIALAFAQCFIGYGEFTCALRDAHSSRSSAMPSSASSEVLTIRGGSPPIP